MRPLIAAALLATIACASAGPRDRPEDLPTDEERAAVVAQERRAKELEQALSASSVGEEPVACPRACELADQICDLARRICLIAGGHGHDADLAARCAAAEHRCARSRERVAPACSCAAR